ncbi:hypothetical protein ABBQ38_008416 [Trebouxia sp. C0009 RCD-2024]
MRCWLRAMLMYQCSNIVVDNSHSQHAPNAQEQHDGILATSSQLFSVDPVGHIANMDHHSLSPKSPKAAVIEVIPHGECLFASAVTFWTCWSGCLCACAVSCAQASFTHAQLIISQMLHVGACLSSNKTRITEYNTVFAIERQNAAHKQALEFIAMTISCWHGGKVVNTVEQLFCEGIQSFPTYEQPQPFT